VTPRAAHRRRTALALAALVAEAGGCLTRSYPEKQRFVLALERPGEPVASGAGVLEVRRVRVAPPFEQKSFVYRTGESTFTEDFYHEFFAPPGLLVQGAALAWLEQAGLFESVTATGDLGVAWRLELEVDLLYADLRDASAPSGVIAMRAKLLDTRASAVEVPLRRRYAAEIAAADARPASLARAWSAALGEILGELEADLAAAVGR
jgi:ABC-type uncharacterized transport system auxiliary subunit